MGKQTKYLSILFQNRWGEFPICPYCNSQNSTTLINKNRYHCNTCFTQYRVTVRTIFHKSRVDMAKWFTLISLLINCRKNYSVRFLAEQLEVNKNTAHYMIQRIDLGLKNQVQRELILKIANYVKNQSTSS